MAVKIRLKQLGSANRRCYRVVAVDESKKRDGAVIETLGAYNPLVKPVQISLKKDRIEFWQKQGAILTEAVKKLLLTP